jgi:hypothetical protein
MRLNLCGEQYIHIQCCNCLLGNPCQEEIISTAAAGKGSACAVLVSYVMLIRLTELVPVRELKIVGAQLPYRTRGISPSRGFSGIFGDFWGFCDPHTIILLRQKSPDFPKEPQKSTSFPCNDIWLLEIPRYPLLHEERWCDVWCELILLQMYISIRVLRHHT